MKGVAQWVCVRGIQSRNNSLVHFLNRQCLASFGVGSSKAWMGMKLLQLNHQCKNMNIRKYLLL